MTLTPSTVELYHLKRKKTNNSTSLCYISRHYNHQELGSFYIACITNWGFLYLKERQNAQADPLSLSTGCFKKNFTFVVSLISSAINMLERWNIIHWKDGIHSFVWSTKTFLCDIWEPRYKQIKMGYQISKCLNIGQS